jgi:hypothetical protein
MNKNFNEQHACKYICLFTFRLNFNWNELMCVCDHNIHCSSTVELEVFKWYSHIKVAEVVIFVLNGTDLQFTKTASRKYGHSVYFYVY